MTSLTIKQDEDNWTQDYCGQCHSLICECQLDRVYFWRNQDLDFDSPFVGNNVPSYSEWMKHHQFAVDYWGDNIPPGFVLEMFEVYSASIKYTPGIVRERMKGPWIPRREDGDDPE